MTALRVLPICSIDGVTCRERLGGMLRFYYRAAA